MSTKAPARLTKICLALPEAYELETWDTPTYRVGRNKMFCVMNDWSIRPAIWLKAPEGSQRILIEAAPERFFRPPYVGHKGWVGMFIDKGIDWAEAETLIRRSYTLVAPRKLANLVAV